MTPQFAREAETGKTGRCRTVGRFIGVLRMTLGRRRKKEDAAAVVWRIVADRCRERCVRRGGVRFSLLDGKNGASFLFYCHIEMLMKQGQKTTAKFGQECGRFSTALRIHARIISDTLEKTWGIGCSSASNTEKKASCLLTGSVRSDYKKTVGPKTCGFRRDQMFLYFIKIIKLVNYMISYKKLRASLLNCLQDSLRDLLVR